MLTVTFYVEESVKRRIRTKQELKILRILRPTVEDGALKVGLIFRAHKVDRGMLPKGLALYLNSGLEHFDVANLYILDEMANPSLKDQVLQRGTKEQRREEFIRSRWMKWPATSDLRESGVVYETKRGDKVNRGLTDFGHKALIAAKRRPTWIYTFENLVLLKAISAKVDGLEKTLAAISKNGYIECICREGREEKSQQIGTFRISPSFPDKPSGLYFLQAEETVSTPHFRTPFLPQVVSQKILNIIYLIHYALRLKLIDSEFVRDLICKRKLTLGREHSEWANEGPASLMSGLTRLGLLKIDGNLRYFRLPDQLLADLVSFIVREKMPLERFAQEMKNSFRIIVSPRDAEAIAQFVAMNEETEAEMIRDFMRANYDSFTDRLVNLGLAHINPDGEVTVGLSI